MKKPALLYDGDCHFCRGWVARWKKSAGDSVEFYAYQEAAKRFPEIPQDELSQAVQLVDSDRRFSGAEAVFRVIAHAGSPWLLKSYQKIPFFAPASEFFYRLVAGHRVFFSKITRLLWGESLEKPTYAIASWIFIRMVGLAYFFAFGSLLFQWRGLWGNQGILPIASYLQALQAHLGASAYSLAPTLCWISGGEGFLKLLIFGGTLASASIILGSLEGPLLILCWLFYLSLVNAGGEFLSFQWDVLLLETGLIAAWLLPWRLWTGLTLREPRRIIRFLLLCLLFKLSLESGLVKILSGDPTWRNLTALYYHYQTQPLPTWIGWWAAQFPHWFLRLSVIGVFAIELGAPLFLLFPRRVKMMGASAIIFLQILIALSGNYGFFNFLALALCVLCFDDRFFEGYFKRAFHFFKPSTARPQERRKSSALFLFAGLWGSLTFLQLAGMIFSVQLPIPVQESERFLEPLHLANSYGPFAVMTTKRIEIVVQGSRDGVDWRDYSFKWKPQDPHQRPAFVEPYQPRLDWQMWFAALEPYRRNSWFTGFLVRILEDSPAVLGLLKNNPFPDGPPRYVRAIYYDYRFTSRAEKSATGNWWHRSLEGSYCPVITLRGDKNHGT